MDIFLGHSVIRMLHEKKILTHMCVRLSGSFIRGSGALRRLVCDEGGLGGGGLVPDDGL